MKLMANIEVLPHTLGGSAEHAVAVLSGFADFLDEHSDRFDVAYGTGWGTGFAILDVDTIEDAWELIMGSSIYQYVRVDMVPLADPVRLTRSLVEKSIMPFAQQIEGS
jgi:hypothetical protein